MLVYSLDSSKIFFPVTFILVEYKGVGRWVSILCSPVGWLEFKQRHVLQMTQDTGVWTSFKGFCGHLLLCPCVPPSVFSFRLSLHPCLLPYLLLSFFLFLSLSDVFLPSWVVFRAIAPAYSDWILLVASRKNKGLKRLGSDKYKHGWIWC